jgi:hypothetical protein
MRFWATLAILLGLGTVTLSSAHGADFQLRVRTALQANGQHNAVDPLLSFLPPDLAASLFASDSGNYDTQYLLAWLQVRGALTFADRISFVATVDSTAVTWEYFEGPSGDADFTAGESPSFDGLSGTEALEKIAFVREFYVESVLGKEQQIYLSVGKRRTQLLGGFFYDDYGLDGSVAWDFWSHEALVAQVRGFAILPHRYLPETDGDLLIAGGELRLKDMLFESIAIGGFYLRDRGGAVQSLLRQGHATDLLAARQVPEGLNVYLSDSPGEAPVDLGTMWLEVRLDLSVAIFHSLVALQVGSGQFPVQAQKREQRSPGRRGEPPRQSQPSPQSSSVDFQGHLALVEAIFPVVRGVSLTPFLLTVSGVDHDQATQDRKFTSFISLIPYVQGYATIFLTGGFGELYSGRNIELIGMGTGGLAAVGTTMRADLGARVSCGFSAALLSQNRPDLGFFSGHYGVEFDSHVSVALGQGLLARGELDLLLPGEYFPSDSAMVMGIVGVRGEF